jgi:hypothetical protein
MTWWLPADTESRGGGQSRGGRCGRGDGERSVPYRIRTPVCTFGNPDRARVANLANDGINEDRHSHACNRHTQKITRGFPLPSERAFLPIDSPDSQSMMGVGSTQRVRTVYSSEMQALQEVCRSGLGMIAAMR